MKKTIKILAVAIFIFASVTSTVMANGGALDTTDFVVNGIILKTNKKLNSKCKVELFYENKLVDSSIIKLNKPFEYKLKKNAWYTVRVTKEGFLPLMISFNTELGNESAIIDNLFRFETALIEVEEAKSLNKDIIDFPVGLVAYNKITQKFEAKEIYTVNYITGLYKPDVLSADIAKECVTKNKLGDGQC